MFGTPVDDFKQALDVCRYMSWADLQSITLSVQLTADDYSQCASLTTDTNNFYLNINKELNFIGAVEFANQTQSYINALMGQQLFSDTFFFTVNS